MKIRKSELLNQIINLETENKRLWDALRQLTQRVKKLDDPMGSAVDEATKKLIRDNERVMFESPVKPVSSIEDIVGLEGLTGFRNVPKGYGR